MNAKQIIQTMRLMAITAAFLLCTGVGLVVVIFGLFWAQSVRLTHLEGEWEKVAPDAAAAKALQEEVREYRDWFGRAAPTLTAAASLAEAFPEDGSVWLKNMTLKDGAQASCSGGAANNRALFEMLDALQSTPGVTELQLSQVRGNAPIDFSFGYVWKRGAEQ